MFCIWFQGKFRRVGSEHDLESSLFIFVFLKSSSSAVYIKKKKKSYPYTLCLLSFPTFLYPPSSHNAGPMLHLSKAASVVLKKIKISFVPFFFGAWGPGNGKRSQLFVRVFLWAQLSRPCHFWNVFTFLFPLLDSCALFDMYTLLFSIYEDRLNNSPNSQNGSPLNNMFCKSLTGSSPVQQLSPFSVVKCGIYLCTFWISFEIILICFLKRESIFATAL